MLVGILLSVITNRSLKYNILWWISSERVCYCLCNFTIPPWSGHLRHILKLQQSLFLNQQQGKSHSSINTVNKYICFQRKISYFECHLTMFFLSIYLFCRCCCLHFAFSWTLQCIVNCFCRYDIENLFPLRCTVFGVTALYTWYPDFTCHPGEKTVLSQYR